jgi:hypothetical protein
MRVCVCSPAYIIQHAQRMRRIALSPVTSLAVPYLHILFHKGQDFLKRRK